MEKFDLKRETRRWVSLGIIAREQEERILNLYASRESADGARVMSRLPGILIGIATLLIGVGIMLFYAANWKRMPPALKLFQVFALVIGTHAVSFYLLLIKRAYPLVGRGFLMLGMISFGAAIGLVAQIYHISGHPTNALLLWLLGTLAISAVMEERWGYYLAAILAFTWNIWEYSEFENPNYAFVVFPIVLLYLFRRKGDWIGILVALFEFFFWFYQINIRWMAEAKGDAVVVAFLLLHVPFGAALIAVSRLADCRKVPALVLSALGRLFVFVPLIGLSWPMKLDFTYYFHLPQLAPVTIEHGLLTLLAGGGVFALYKKKKEFILPLSCLVYGLVVVFAPMGHKTTLVVTTHLGLLAYLLGLLYFSYADAAVDAGIANGTASGAASGAATDAAVASGVAADAGAISRTVNHVLAFLMAIVALFAKGFGLFGLGLAHGEYRVAYCIGFLIFATVIFLINQYVRALFRDRPDVRYPAAILDSLTALAAFLMLYALAFEVPVQKSVFQAEVIVLVLIALFIGIALVLYGMLWVRGAEQLPVVLSAFILALSVIVLFTAGPAVSWRYYSVIFNFLLFVMAATLIYYSTRVNSALLANAAIAGLVLQIFTRYFDLFWDLLDGSVLFITTGIIVFGGGFLLEKNRRKLIAKIEAGHKEESNHASL